MWSSGRETANSTARGCTESLVTSQYAFLQGPLQKKQTQVIYSVSFYVFLNQVKPIFMIKYKLFTGAAHSLNLFQNISPRAILKLKARTLVSKTCRIASQIEIVWSTLDFFRQDPLPEEVPASQQWAKHDAQIAQSCSQKRFGTHHRGANTSQNSYSDWGSNLSNCFAHLRIHHTAKIAPRLQCQNSGCALGRSTYSGKLSQTSTTKK